MKFILDFFKGVLIGAGCILPGISSGVLCVIFGIYDKLLDSILNFFKDVQKNFRFLLPIAIGGMVGIIVFSKILQYFLYNFPLHTNSIFIGLILGGTILLFKQISSQSKFNLKDIILYVIPSLVLGVLMVYLENKIGIKTIQNVSNIYLILSGFLMSVGIVVPGVSSTIILMLMGIYSIYLNSISSLYLPVLLPMAVGLFIGSIFFMKIIQKMLDKFYNKTMLLIIGFTLGSIFVLMPQVQSITEIIICILCMTLGYYLMKIINV